MGIIKAVRARFIVPFMIKKDSCYSEIVGMLEDTYSKWIPFSEDEEPRFERDLLDSVAALITSGEDTVYNIGRHYELKHEKKTPVFSGIYNSPDGLELKFDISECGLFVFKSGACFLWYQTEFSEIDSDLFISFVNEFKELSYKRLSVPDRRRENKIPLVVNGSGFLSGDHIKNMLLGELSGAIDFFAPRKSPSDGSDIPDKAIMFIYSVYDDPSYEKDMYLYTNGFNSKYKVPSDLSDSCCKLFDNVTCYMTANGCSYNGFYDDSNKGFFLQTMKNKIMGDYFLMFILVLHQYYGIMNFNIRINSTIPAEFDKGRDTSAPDELLSTLNDLTMDINFFMSKNFFPSVSHIYHQNEFYYYLQERLNISRNLNYLTIGLDAMRQMDMAFINRRNDENEKREAKENEKASERLEIAFSALSVLTIFSAVADGDATLEIISGLISGESALTAARIILLCGLAGILIIVLIALIKTIIKYFK